MRSDRVLTNLTCNQNCTYCTDRRPAEERAFIRGDAVRARIDAALRGGAVEVVLSGGEPTLRSDLPSIVAYAKKGGAASLVLETNATVLDAQRVRALREAGLTAARVNLSGWGEALDDVTRDPGGHARTLAGLAALIDGGVAVEIAAVVIRSTLSLLADLPGHLAKALGERLSGIKSIVVRTPVESPNAAELVSYEQAAEAIAALEASARRAGIALKLGPDSGPPPCAFPHPNRVAHLYSLTPGATLRADHRQVEACDRCQMKDRCSGLPISYLARHAPPPMRPITEDRVRRRLSLIATVEEQIARELSQPNRFERPETGVIEEHIIRVNFHCNQACRFCFVSTHLPPAGDAAVRKAIVAAGEAGARVMLSGGEPTLTANLVDYVKLAKQVSSHPVGLQSNAIRLADPALTNALVEAGIEEAFVSLHGSTAEISDAITEAPGTFDKSVIGIDNLHRATSVCLILNFVIHERNIEDLVPYVRLVASRWPRAYVNISFVAPSSDVVPKEKALVPRYAEALPSLALAVQEAKALGLQIGGFESMCGIPLCLVPMELSPYFSLSDIPEGFDRGEFVKTPACQDCELKNKCYGLRRGYLALHGDDELKPVHAPSAAE
ncbi:Radical SAM domain heme biosynthesis protein [Minicystis rosea]|nr:Radical SAM domain heme biosynthesis protein [Minicystis rosea]